MRVRLVCQKTYIVHQNNIDVLYAEGHRKDHPVSHHLTRMQQHQICLLYTMVDIVAKYANTGMKDKP